MKHKTVKATPVQMADALNEIAKIGERIPDDKIDYKNCYKRAIYIATEVMRPKCKECGK